MYSQLLVAELTEQSANQSGLAEEGKPDEKPKSTSCNQKEEKRFALVIGNQYYRGGDENVSPKWDDILVGPHNDAEEMAKALIDLEFDVTLVKDANIDQMNSVIDKFFNSVVGSHTTTLFYFSGHGGQNDQDIIIPVKIPVKITPDEVYWVSDVLKKAPKGECNTNVIILDACREKSGSLKGLENKDALKIDRQSSANFLVAYATAPGGLSSAPEDSSSSIWGYKCNKKQQHSDNPENSEQPGDADKCLSLYTYFLLENIRHHGPYYEVFVKTRQAVVNYLREKQEEMEQNNTAKAEREDGDIDKERQRQERLKSQTPWENNSLLESFHFVPRKLSGGFQ
jgi:hypothetical protein